MQGIVRRLGKVGGFKSRTIERHGSQQLTPKAISNGQTDRLQSKSTIHWQDSTGSLAALAAPLIEEYFPTLSVVKFLWIWKYPFETTDEGCPVAASVKKLPPREQDIYGFNVEVAFDPMVFLQYNAHNRSRIVYHELSHVSLDTEEDMRPKRDGCGRLVVHCLPHDIVVHSFRDEVKLYGLPDGIKGTVEFLSRNLHNGRGA